MKKITGIFFLIGLLAASLFTINASSNIGFNTSGAPGEGSCAACHTGSVNPDNLGSINIWINGNNTNGTYTPDSIYHIEVISAHPGIKKFGFALNARYQGQEFVNAGTFLYDVDSSILVSDYVTHTQYSHSGNTLKTWKFKWKAPTNPLGQKITFYAAGVMANNDSNSTGDKVYTDSISLFSNTSNIYESVKKAAIEVAKREFDWVITSSYPIQEIKLYTLNGQEVSTNITKISNDTYSLQVNTKEIGINLLKVQTERGIWAAKLLNQ